MEIAIKRAYAPASVGDGTRVLVEREWPRGLGKDKARIDAWLAQLAPAPELRTWFEARQAQWPAFRKRYLAGLAQPDSAQALDQLYDMVRARKKITLVFSAKDEQQNHAAILHDLIAGMRKPPSSSGPAAAATARRIAKRRP